MTIDFIFLQRLSLDGDADERAIRRAYARELKQIDQQADPAGFQSLREAYDTALYWVRHKEEFEDEEFEDNTTQSELQAAIEQDVAQPAQMQPPAPSLRPPEYQAADQAHRRPLQERLDTDHDALAAAVFTDFLQRAAAIAHERPVTPDAPWRRELRASLDDPRLINIIARETFERCVADLLISGWRPGHESLLVAAVNTFGWSEDRRRVFSLGRSGAMLDAAIDERATFDLQPGADREGQRQLIERLRDPRPPGTRELVRNSATLETLIARFPTWLALITDVDNVVRWREQNGKLPAWRRKLTFTGVSKPAEHSYGHQKKGIVNWGWVIVLGLVALIRFLAHDGSGNTSSKPDEATRYFNLGTRQLNEGDPKGAIDSFTKVIELKPDESEAYGNRAAAYLDTGDDQRASKDFDKFAEHNPNSPLLFRGRGMLALEAGRNDEAIAAFTRALALEPHHAFALTRRAEAYDNANNPGKALADIDEALRVGNNLGPRPYILRMKIFAQQGNNAQAIAQIEPMLAASPASPVAYIKAANLQIQLHNREKAIALLDRGVIATADPDIYLYRAQLRPRQDKQGRERDIHSGLELAPNSIYGHRLRAELELENGDPAAAIATLSKIVDNPNITASPMPALIQRGVIQLKNGKPSLAQADFARAHATAKTAAELNDVAWELARLNVALPTALSIAREAVAKQPGTVVFIDSEAFILLRLGRYKEAIERYDAVLAISPKLPAALFGRGIAKRRMGRSSAGDADLKAARAIFAAIDSRFSQFGVVP